MYLLLSWSFAIFFLINICRVMFAKSMDTNELIRTGVVAIIDLILFLENLRRFGIA